MKLQVLLIFWSVLKSLFVFSSCCVATSQFICIASWLAGFCMLQVFWWGDFRTVSRTLSTFVILLTLLFNTFHKLQVTSFRTLSKCLLLFILCITYILQFSFKVFITDILANCNFSDLPWFHILEAYLEPNRIPMVEQFCKNS